MTISPASAAVALIIKGLNVPPSANWSNGALIAGTLAIASMTVLAILLLGLAFVHQVGLERIAKNLVQKGILA